MTQEGEGTRSAPAVLAVVPARRGSKGIPGKNLRAVGGRSLVRRAVDAALGSSHVTTIAVTTDDPEVVDEVRELSVSLVNRPAELADDHAPLIDVVLHAATSVGVSDPGALLVLLQPTSPLRTEAHIDAAVRMLVDEARPAVLSVTESEHHPKKMLRLDGDTVEPLFGREWLHRSRQELEPVFRQNGAVYAVRLGVLRDERTFCPPGCGALRMSREESVDVDEPSDLALAEWILGRGGQ